jgi:hypothetical protein
LAFSPQSSSSRSSRDPEVQQLYRSICFDQDIRGLQIAMNNEQRMSVHLASEVPSTGGIPLWLAEVPACVSAPQAQ